MKPFGYALATVVVLLLLYVGLYFSLVTVRPTAGPAFRPGEFGAARRSANYRFGGELAASVFAPIHHLDAEYFRRGTWWEVSLPP